LSPEAWEVEALERCFEGSRFSGYACIAKKTHLVAVTVIAADEASISHCEFRDALMLT
jgi:hypothetical protein